MSRKRLAVNGAGPPKGGLGWVPHLACATHRVN